MDSTYRKPTLNNPFMNVPVRNYDTPSDQAGPVPATWSTQFPRNPVAAQQTSQEVKNDFIGDGGDFMRKLYQGADGRLFDRFNSQRQYFTEPITKAYTDQTAFAQWLYGRPYVCKGGSIWMRYGVPYTDDSLVCTGAEGDGQITNFGIMDGNNPAVDGTKTNWPEIKDPMWNPALRPGNA